jgi:hypothetical protein
LFILEQQEQAEMEQAVAVAVVADQLFMDL